MSTQQSFHLQASIPPECADKRLDQALAMLFKEHSRSRLKLWIEQGWVRVNGQNLRPKDKVFENDQIEIHAEQDPAQENSQSQFQSQSQWQPQAIDLDIIYQDEHILVLNKPANLVVHPAVGNRQGTLVNALLHAFPGLQDLPRAGVVHRLDKDTTGVMVVALSLLAHTSLVNQLQARTLRREYVAIVCGNMPSGGTVSTCMGRHPRDRKKMAVLEEGKPAVTHYRVLKRFKAHTALDVKLETGRTHQIRVHMAHIQYPIVGDRTYGGRLRMPPDSSAFLLETLRTFPRQALHAKTLGLQHPVTGEWMNFEAPLPEDMKVLWEALLAG